jgi:hypothetical protein
MSTTFFVRRGSRIFGPVGSSELKRRAKQGSLLSSDEISRDRDQWIPARDIAELEFGVAGPAADPASPVVYADTDTVETGSTEVVVPAAPCSANSAPPTNRLELPTERSVPPTDCNGSAPAALCPHCGFPNQNAQAANLTVSFQVPWKIVVAGWLVGTLCAALTSAVIVLVVT